MGNISTPSATARPSLSASDLLHVARTSGIPAFGGDATAGGLLPAKILIASICDPSDPVVARRLLQLHQAGEIRLARVDLVGAVPDDRRDLLARSAIRHLGAQFDAILVEAA